MYLKSVSDALGQVNGTAVENRECREQEYRDEAGDCVACRQCGSGQELSTVSSLSNVFPPVKIIDTTSHAVVRI